MILEAVIREIETANAMETEVLMDVVFERKRQLFPDWEMIYLALPKEDRVRRELTLKNLLEWERQTRKLLEGQKELL